MLVTDIDDTLLGNRDGLDRLLAWLEERRGEVAFVVATGRTLASARAVLKKWGVPAPDVIVASVGTEIYYGPGHGGDDAWTRHIAWHWRRDALIEALAGVPGLVPQPEANLGAFKISYNVGETNPPRMASIRQLLRARGLRARLVHSHGSYLDVLPVRASKGQAIRYLSYRWDVPLGNVLVAGDSGNDECMLRGDTLGVVVGNYSRELETLRGRGNVYFAAGTHAAGILEGIEAYGFADSPRARLDRAAHARAALGAAG
jgi:sucrose-phosphate synthase